MADNYDKMLKYILNNSQELIVGFNEYGGIVYVNDRTYEITGYIPEELIGMYIDELYKDVFVLANQRIKLKEGYRKEEQIETFLYRKNKTCFPVGLKVVTIKDNGKVYYFCMAVNMTRYKLSLRKLEETTEKLRDSMQERDSFVANVTHELRTPMTTISGFLEGILDGTIPEKDRDEYLKVALSESKRLSRLVTNLLQISRIESGENTVNKIVFDINELVRLSLIKFEMMITSKNLEVDLNIDDEKIYVFADKDSITQVLINLINNAVKFTPDGGKIVLDVKVLSDKAFVSVINTGHGIENDKLEFIWDRFYKVDSSRSTDRGGVGLGLYIVKQIIDMHGEKINVQSVVDDFTRFTFTLSLANSQSTISIEAPRDDILQS